MPIGRVGDSSTYLVIILSRVLLGRGGLILGLENGITPCDTGSELTDSFKAPFPHVDFSAVDPVFPDKTSQSAKKYYCTRDAVVERGRQCLEGLHGRKEKVVFVVSHSGLMRVGVTRCMYANADYRIFEFDSRIQREEDTGRWKIVQDPTTFAGGLGTSRTETVELGDELPEEQVVLRGA